MKKTKRPCLPLLSPGSLFLTVFWSSAGWMSHVSQQLSACLSPVSHVKQHSAIPEGSCRGFLPQIPVPRAGLLTLPLSLSKSDTAWKCPCFPQWVQEGTNRKTLPGMLEIKLMVAAGSDRFALVGCSDRSIRRHLAIKPWDLCKGTPVLPLCLCCSELPS